MNTVTQLETSVGQEPALRKLLLIDDLPNGNSADLIDKLQALQYSALEVSKGINELLAKVTSLSPDVLILSVENLDKTTLDQLVEIHQTCPLPVIVVANKYSRGDVETVVFAGVSSYLVDQVSVDRLTVIIDLSIARFKQEQTLISELQVTKEKLSDRKLIERAKGIIMKQKHLSEEEAYAQMRKSAMNQGQSMSDLAKRIISVFEMLE